MLNNPPIKTHPCCLKNLRQALPDGPRPETLSIVFNEWLGLFLLGKKRPDVTGVNWHPPVQRLICRTLVARCLMMVDKQRSRLCGPTANCLVETLHKRVLQWPRSRCRCLFCRWCPCLLLGQTKMFCIFQFYRQRWQIGKSDLINPTLNCFLNVQTTIGLNKIKIHCILLVWERFVGGAFFELILALYPSD